MRLPRKISGYRADVINEIIDYLEMHQVLPSSDHRIEQTTHGAFLKNINKPDHIEDFPFRGSTAGSEIRVTVGDWTRLGTKLSLAPDTDKTYKTLTTDKDGADFANTTKYYVYLELSDSGATYDPALAPNTLSVKAATTVPVDTGEIAGNIIRVLGDCTTDAYGRFGMFSQDWRGGAIDDIAYVPDANSSHDESADKRYYSIEFSPRSDNHVRTLQDWNWDHATTTTPDMTDDLILFRDVVGTGDDQYFEKKYCSPENLKVGDASHADEADEADHAGSADTVVTHTHYHYDHTFGTDDHTGQHAEGQLDRYIRHNGTASRNNMSGVIGDAAGSPKTSIAPNTRLLTQEDGVTTILDWTSNPALNLSATAWFKNNSGAPLFQIDADNAWSAAELKAKVSGAISLDASTGGALTLKAKNASTWDFADKVDWNIGAASTWVLKDDLTIQPDVSGTHSLNLGWYNRFDIINLYVTTTLRLSGNATGELWLGGGPSGNFANIYFNGVLGVDISGWTTKGGLTGANIVERTVANLQPGDKVLCIPG